MNKNIKQAIENIIPFLILGVALSLAIGVFIMFSYVLFWGLLIGAVLWIMSIIKNFFLPDTKKINPTRETKGRIIEHNEKDRY